VFKKDLCLGSKRGTEATSGKVKKCLGKFKNRNTDYIFHVARKEKIEDINILMFKGILPTEL
jgi:hypothetical protein